MGIDIVFVDAEDYGTRIHPALHIGNHILICLVMENALIVHQTQVVFFLEELLHRSDIILGIRFISQGPEQD